ncbi:hypothetical protein IFU30_12415 [Plantibacter sp. CFBP 8798]|nr:hypothetical protein [Plantibacter sp. CFBP 8798]
MRPAAHMTPDVSEAIRTSDEVYYLLADPLAELDLLALRPDAANLYEEYSSKANRRESYADVADRVISRAIAGASVCFVTYGDPSFGTISTSMIRNSCLDMEIPIRVLPGVSSVACLTADLGIDFLVSGVTGSDCNRLLRLPSSALSTVVGDVLVLWQPASVSSYELSPSVSASDQRELGRRIALLMGDEASLFRYRAGAAIEGFVLEHFDVSDIAGFDFALDDTIVVVKDTALRHLPVLHRAAMRGGRG